MSLDPILDGASHECLLLLGQPIGPHCPVEVRTSRGSKGRREILSIAVDSTDVRVDDAVPVAAGLYAIVTKVIGASGLSIASVNNTNLGKTFKCHSVYLEQFTAVWYYGVQSGTEFHERFHDGLEMLDLFAGEQQPGAEENVEGV